MTKIARGGIRQALLALLATGAVAAAAVGVYASGSGHGTTTQEKHEAARAEQGEQDDHPSPGTSAVPTGETSPSPEARPTPQASPRPEPRPGHDEADNANQDTRGGNQMSPARRPR